MANETMVMGIEDVLFQGDRLLERHHTVLKGLATSFRTVLLSTGSREAAQDLLRLNRVAYDILLTKDDSILDDTAWKASAVRECLGIGWRVGLFLDVDPMAVMQVFAMGVSSLLLSHHMLRPSWLPDQGPPRAWDDLVAFREQQNEKSARMAGPETVTQGAGPWDGRHSY
jgi:hypothetical protein